MTTTLTLKTLSNSPYRDYECLTLTIPTSQSETIISSLKQLLPQLHSINNTPLNNTLPSNTIPLNTLLLKVLSNSPYRDYECLTLTIPTSQSETITTSLKELLPQLHSISSYTYYPNK